MQTDSAVPTSFFPQNNSTVDFDIPGESDIRTVIIYSSVSRQNAPPPPDRVTVVTHASIAVPRVKNIIGIGTISDYAAANPGPFGRPATAISLGGQPGVWFYFVLASKGNTIGPQLFPISAQEKATNVMNLTFTPPQSMGDDHDFKPTAPDNRFFFSQINNNGEVDYAICDFKINQSIVPRPSGKYLSNTQELQLTWTDRSNTPIAKSIATYNYAVWGTNAPDQWSTRSN